MATQRFIVYSTNEKPIGGIILKFGETIVLLMLATFIVVPTMLAVDYSAAESVVEDMLLDPDYNLPIESADVSISTE